MKTLTIIYLAATAAVFAYVGGVCFFKRCAPAAGTLGLIIAAIGLILIAWNGRHPAGPAPAVPTLYE